VEGGFEIAVGEVGEIANRVSISHFLRLFKGKATSFQGADGLGRLLHGNSHKNCSEFGWHEAEAVLLDDRGGLWPAVNSTIELRG
jgi:hypothetical protein